MLQQKHEGFSTFGQGVLPFRSVRLWTNVRFTSIRRKSISIWKECLFCRVQRSLLLTRFLLYEHLHKKSRRTNGHSIPLFQTLNWTCPFRWISPSSYSSVPLITTMPKCVWQTHPFNDLPSPAILVYLVQNPRNKCNRDPQRVSQ